MAADPRTVADLRKAGILSSQSIVAAISAYMYNLTAGPYRYASGNSPDVPAIVASAISPKDIASWPRP